MRYVVSDGELERAIDRLVREGKVERITMPDGAPGVRLLSKPETGVELRPRKEKSK